MSPVRPGCRAGSAPTGRRVRDEHDLRLQPVHHAPQRVRQVDDRALGLPTRRGHGDPPAPGSTTRTLAYRTAPCAWRIGPRPPRRTPGTRTPQSAMSARVSQCCAMGGVWPRWQSLGAPIGGSKTAGSRRYLQDNGRTPSPRDQPRLATEFVPRVRARTAGRGDTTHARERDLGDCRPLDQRPSEETLAWWSTFERRLHVWHSMCERSDGPT